MVAGDEERAKANGFERDSERNTNYIVFDPKCRDPGLVGGNRK